MIEGRTKKAARNITYNVGNQILSLVLTFVSRTFFIKYLGAEYLGISGLFVDILNMLSLADLGFNTAMVYSLYEPLKNNNQERISALITFYRKIYLLIALAVSVIGVALIPVLPYIINLENDIPNINIYYLLSLANVVVSYLCVYKTSVLNADQKQYKVTTVTIIVGTVRTIIQILFLVFFKSYLLYLIIGCAGVFTTNIVSSFIATKEYPYIKTKRALNTEERKDIFVNIRSVFLYKVSTVLITATDNTLISILVGTLAVGYYSNYLLLQNKIVLFYSIIFTSLTASIGNLVVSENDEKRYAVFNAAQSLCFVICGIIVPCYVVLINDFIKIWAGSEYVLSISATIAIGMNMYLSCALQPLWSFREATGLYKKTKWIIVVCAVLNILLSILLGKLMGVAGIIFASSISKICTYIWYEPMVLFKDYFSRKPAKYYFSLFGNLILVSGIVIVCLLVAAYFSIDSWISWIIKAIIVGTFSLLVVYFVYRKSEGVNKLKSVVLSLFKHKKNNGVS